jgi:hypothetical protein
MVVEQMNLNKLYFAQKYEKDTWQKKYTRWLLIESFEDFNNLKFKREYYCKFETDHSTDAMRYAVREGKEL